MKLKLKNKNSKPSKKDQSLAAPTPIISPAVPPASTPSSSTSSSSVVLLFTNHSCHSCGHCLDSIVNGPPLYENKGPDPYTGQHPTGINYPLFYSMHYYDILNYSAAHPDTIVTIYDKNWVHYS